MIFLVLGGAGFIGRHVLQELASRHEKAWVCDVLAPGGGAQFDRFYHRDELETDAAPQWLSEVNVVIHLAWTTQPGSSNDNPVFDVQTNVVNSLRYLDFCVQAGVRKVVFLSSGGTVYGVPRALPMTEVHPTHPISSYGITKLAVEKYLQLYNHCHGLEYMILRASNAYGEWQQPERGQGIVSTLMWRILHDLPLVIYGDGSIVRDYIHAQDIARAVLDASTHPVAGLTLNVGCGHGTSIHELVEELRRITSRDFVIQHGPARSFDVPAVILDVAEIERSLGWRPEITLSTGLRRTWNWLACNQDKLSIPEIRQ